MFKTSKAFVVMPEAKEALHKKALNQKRIAEGE